MKIYTRLQNFIYILQLEEYDNSRLLKWLPKFFWKFGNIQLRERLIWTNRVKLMFLGTVLTQVFTVILFIYLLFSISRVNFISIFLTILAITILYLLTPLFLYFSNAVLELIINIQKKSIYKQAEAKILRNKNLAMRIVVIAGSFGKSTLKNYIYELTKLHYKVQMIPGNINTPGGIADWINLNLNITTNLLIAEADTYRKGEIQESCEILHPDIAILTNVGDQHLERFRSSEKLAECLTEVFKFSESDSKCLYLEENENYISLFRNNFNIGNRIFITIKNGEYVNIVFAKEVAKLLQIPDKFLLDNEALVSSLKILERRGDHKDYLGFQAFDHSYNISLTTAKFALLSTSKYSKMKGKKLIVITGGIPEVLASNVWEEFGRDLNQYADVVILAKSDCYKIISESIEKRKVFLIDRYLDLSEKLKDYDRNEYILLLFPELNDLYY